MGPQSCAVRHKIRSGLYAEHFNLTKLVCMCLIWQAN